ncbi:MAG: dATP/dGTP pyrophosphohydrolase domain-containing protein [Bacteroides graminisolvens]|jgi:NTP pyrophosphatase (non-canonical NTP hydrolase)|uniref:dATP/dGTP pyrophosphohydrolase domain-containing protein n=1 Tax=Bacteroides graminisolvens TaxID=477666 RepID=UPI003A878A7F
MSNKGLERMQILMNEIRAWSDLQFDNGIFRPSRSLAISKHLQREAKELTVALEKYGESGCYAPVMEELADVLILLLDVATHTGNDVDALLTAANNKLQINKKRKWGEPDTEGVIEHIDNDD